MERVYNIETGLPLPTWVLQARYPEGYTISVHPMWPYNLSKMASDDIPTLVPEHDILVNAIAKAISSFLEWDGSSPSQKHHYQNGCASQ